MRPHFIREAPGWQETTVTAFCIAACLFLLSLNVYEWGYSEGKKSQLAAMECPKNSPGVVSRKVDVDGSVTCYYPQEPREISGPEMNRRNIYRRGAI